LISTPRERRSCPHDEKNGNGKNTESPKKQAKIEGPLGGMEPHPGNQKSTSETLGVYAGILVCFVDAK